MMRKVVAVVLVVSVLLLSGLPAVAQVPTSTSIDGNVRKIEWSPNGQFLAIIARGVWIYDQSSLYQLPLNQPVSDIAWKADSTKLAVALSPVDIQIWTVDISHSLVELEKTIIDIDTPVDDSFYVDWHPQEDWLTVTGKNVRVWDIDTEALMATLPSDLFYTFLGEWSPDGNHVVIDNTGSLDVLDADTGVLEASFTSTAYRSVWNSASNRIATIDSQNVDIIIWDSSTGMPIFTIDPSGATFVTSADWKGNTLAAVTDSGISIWDSMGQPIITFPVIGVGEVALSPDGSQIAYVENGQVQVQTIPMNPNISCDYEPLDAVQLIADISSANGTPEADTICLVENATYTLTTTNNGLNGLPLITSEIVVEGNGATLTRDGAAPNFRFWEVMSTGNLTLNDLTITNGSTPGNQGGAIRNAGGVITLNEVTFTQNASNTGGSVDSDSGTVYINNSTFTSNTSEYGGAIDNDETSTMTITGSIFNNNTAGHHGGAIQNDGGQMTITGSLINTNTANQYGGGVENSGTLIVTNTTFSQNIALKRGGAISNSGNLTLNGNTQLLNNLASTGEGWGGGLINQTNATASLTDVLIQGNTAAADGGGIRNHSSLTLTNVVIEQNTATNSGGGIFNVSSGNINLSNVDVRQNGAANGGGLYNSSSISIATINNSRFENNTASDRGGFGHLYGTVTIANSKILNNSSTNQGGGAYISSAGTVTAQNSCIVGNSATAIFKGSTPKLNWQGNWWGAANGPTGAGGSGDSVTNNTIDSANFLTAGCPLP